MKSFITCGISWSELDALAWCVSEAHDMNGLHSHDAELVADRENLQKHAAKAIRRIRKLKKLNAKLPK